MREVIGRYKFSADQLGELVKYKIAPGAIDKARASEGKFTVDQFVQMAEIGILDSDNRLELIDGVILEMAPTGRPHGRRTHRIARMFGRILPEEIEVSVQSTIRLNDWSGPEPDIALLTPEASLDEKNVPRAGDILLIIEVSASNLQTDLGPKPMRYARSGIPELWILILATEEIEVCRQPTPEGYADVQRYRRGDTLTVQALPEAQITVDDLLQ